MRLFHKKQIIILFAVAAVSGSYGVYRGIVGQSENPPAQAPVSEIQVSTILSHGQAYEEWKNLAQSVNVALSSLEYRTLINKLLSETDEKELFKIARELNRHQNSVLFTIHAIKRLPSSRKAIALHALLGRSEKKVLDFAIELFLKDTDPAVQAKAAFLLQEVAEQAPPSIIEQASERALQNIRSSDTPTDVLTESMELLAMLHPDKNTEKLLLQVFDSHPSQTVKNASLRALANTGTQNPRVKKLAEEFFNKK